MASGGREHQHKCPECGIVWRCSEYQCYRTNYAEKRLCRGSKCAQLVKTRPPKPPPEPRLF